MKFLLALAARYWKPLAIVGAILGLFVYHRIAVAWAHHEGVIDGKAQMQVQLDQAAVDNAALKAQVKDANTRIDALALKAQAAQAASARALADEEVKAKVWQEQSTRLMAILTRPPSHDPQICDRASALLDPAGM